MRAEKDLQNVCFVNTGFLNISHWKLEVRGGWVGVVRVYFSCILLECVCVCVFMCVSGVVCDVGWRC